MSAAHAISRSASRRWRAARAAARRARASARTTPPRRRGCRRRAPRPRRARGEGEDLPGRHRAPDTVADAPQEARCELCVVMIWRSGSVFGKDGGREHCRSSLGRPRRSLPSRSRLATATRSPAPTPTEGSQAGVDRTRPLRLPTTGRSSASPRCRSGCTSRRAAARASSATCASARPSRGATSPPGTDGCPGGWYSHLPAGLRVRRRRGHARRRSAPLVRAASARPDLSKPLPYHYGFVRAVAPQYLKVPEQGGAARERVRAREAPGVVERGGVGGQRGRAGRERRGARRRLASPSTARRCRRGREPSTQHVAGRALRRRERQRPGAVLARRRAADPQRERLQGAGATRSSPTACAATRASPSSAASPRATTRSIAASR